MPTVVSAPQRPVFHNRSRTVVADARVSIVTT
jgi:hypothetical protein